MQKQLSNLTAIVILIGQIVLAISTNQIEADPAKHCTCGCHEEHENKIAKLKELLDTMEEQK